MENKPDGVHLRFVINSNGSTRFEPIPKEPKKEFLPTSKTQTSARGQVVIEHSVGNPNKISGFRLVSRTVIPIQRPSR